MIPIPTNESISQMTLVQMCRYIIDLLTDYLPYAEQVESAATGAENAKTAAENSATAAAVSATAAANSATAAANSATAAAAEFAKIAPAVADGLQQIQSAVTTVLNTEV